ncbi:MULTISPECIES: protoporphyrinogen oxidase HemJ [Cobetia]|uniref:Protoporphyrinogen IX oxidase n=1 Tax=Cobetia crustatorum TaxID=553385 RepID=A0A558HS18_9GAMM|nr:MULTISPECIES: protoporphyrinogen oxidase HemJ [Cobetia]TVU71933.1 protoporphyrinogen oxidase HemJ [Cobetia crustatorum]
MYLWIKAFHLIAVVCWFAALFYMPRLFVYHVEARDAGDSQAIAYFKTMQRKLYRGIMIPSMIATLVLGIWLLALVPSFMSMGWMHLKLTMVVLLIGYHHACGLYMKKLAADNCHKTSRYFRFFNEVPVLMLVVIVICVIVKPF